MLGQLSQPSPHLSHALGLLASSASRPNWLVLEDVDVPLHQKHLSLAIDDASHQELVTSTSSTRARALAVSSALPPAGDWLNGVPSAALGLHLKDKEYGDHQVGCGGNG